MSDLIAKKGRPPSGRGVYIRKYLDFEKSARYDVLCRILAKSRSDVLGVAIDALMAKHHDAIEKEMWEPAKRSG